MPSDALDIRGLRLAFGGAPFVDGLSLRVGPGEFVALLGPSGAGKTSLLRAAAGLLEPDGGAIERTGGGVAYMAQSDLLMPWLTAERNVALGARLRGERPDLARARVLLADVGLEGRERARPAELSGGMRQRVALARTLYEDRPLVLLDEPFAALDALTRRSMQALARKRLAGRAALLVTHDPFEALAIADRVAVMAGAPARVVHAEALPPARALRDPYDPAFKPAHDRLIAAIGLREAT